MVSRAAVLIILGSPASGKTTLAARLATDLEIPCYSKDAVKEALFATLGVGDREWSRRLSAASFAAVLDLARTQTSAGGTCIVEGNWRAEHAAALAATPARSAQIRVCVDPEEARRRFRARRRHPGHLDALLADDPAVFPSGGDGFLALPGPRWEVRGDAGGDYDALADSVRLWLAR